MAIFNLTGMRSGGSSGITHYEIVSEYYVNHTQFDLKNAGLTVDDFVLDANTIMWIECLQNIPITVYLDSNDDDDFSITLPSGTKLFCVNTIPYGGGATEGFFAFANGTNAPYGYITLSTYIESPDIDVVVIDGYGYGAEYGAIVRVPGYQITDNGAPVSHDMGRNGALKLHILKLA